ncbi:MAG TPA: formate hydrogenlyase maturation HycH family protein [Anaerolineae bacterium]|nr:formate hydrogenlyase maturation HycH family protein [Anaerolineae bacterium]
MPQQVVFYRLSHKFVDSRDAPAESRNLIYYSLAIGHHVGVLDCFSSALSMASHEYVAWIAQLPPGDGRRKLEGVLKWGEIEINKDHVNSVASALLTGLATMPPPQQHWTQVLLQLLHNIDEEPVMYLMVRMHYNGAGSHSDRRQ